MALRRFTDMYEAWLDRRHAEPKVSIISMSGGPLPDEVKALQSKVEVALAKLNPEDFNSAEEWHTAVEVELSKIEGVEFVSQDKRSQN